MWTGKNIARNPRARLVVCSVNSAVSTCAEVDRRRGSREESQRAEEGGGGGRAEDFPRTAGANLNNSRSAVLWKVEETLHHMIRFCVCVCVPNDQRESDRKTLGSFDSVQASHFNLCDDDAICIKATDAWQ